MRAVGASGNARRQEIDALNQVRGLRRAAAAADPSPADHPADVLT